MKCPGQDSRYWKPGAIFETECPQCLSTVEFFKDDTTRRCRKCGHRFLNPQMDFGCASYCKYAEQCLGSLSPELLAQQENLMNDRVAVEIKRYFKQDFKRIGHTMRVARHAESIGKKEQGDLAVILIAAYLQDIGRIDGGIKSGGPSDPRSEGERLVVAREILSKVGAADSLVEEVFEIIAGDHGSEQKENVNYRVVHDAEMLADLEERHKKEPVAGKTLASLLDHLFLTKAGRDLARKIFST